MSLPTHCHAMLPKITRVTAQTCSMSAYNYRSCVSSKTFARSLSKTFVPWNQQQYQVSRQKFFSSTSKRLSKKKDGPGIGKSIEGKGRGGLWEWWTAPVDMPPRKSVRWYAEMALVSTVFGVTGSTTMFLVRPLILWSILLNLFLTEKIHPAGPTCHYRFSPSSWIHEGWTVVLSPYFTRYYDSPLPAFARHRRDHCWTARVLQILCCKNVQQVWDTTSPTWRLWSVWKGWW